MNNVGRALETALTRYFRGRKWDFQSMFTHLRTFGEQCSLMRRTVFSVVPQIHFFFSFSSSEPLARTNSAPTHTHTLTLYARLPPTDIHLDAHSANDFISCIWTLSRRMGNPNSCPVLYCKENTVLSYITEKSKQR